MTKEEILEAIAGMSVVEVVELVAAMEEKFGGDNLEDMKKNFNSYMKRIREI